MNVKDIEVKKIRVKQNVRIKTDASSVAGLMRDIKQNGLMQPVGVATANGGYDLVWGSRRLEACKKLGWKTISAHINEIEPKDQVIRNMSENLHRKNVTPYELGRMCYNYIRTYDSNLDEVAAFLSISRSKVQGSVLIFQKIPEDVGEDIIFGNRSQRKGKIPMGVVNRILKQAFTQKQKVTLLENAKKYGLTVSRIEIVHFLVKNKGSTIKQALEEMGAYKLLDMRILSRASEHENLRKQLAKNKKYKSDTGRVNVSKFIRGCLLGEETLPKELIV